MPRWTRRPDGKESAPFRITIDLTRRQYATMVAYANENTEGDIKVALDAIFLIGYQEIAKTYDPVERKGHTL